MNPPLAAALAVALASIAILASACASTDGGKRIPARFECDDGARLDLVFDHVQDAAVVRLPKGKSAILPSQHPAAGMVYSGGGYELRGSGDTVSYAAPDRPQTRCTQTR